jgi:hypothetical protein
LITKKAIISISPELVSSHSTLSVMCSADGR